MKKVKLNQNAGFVSYKGNSSKISPRRMYVLLPIINDQLSTFDISEAVDGYLYPFTLNEAARDLRPTSFNPGPTELGTVHEDAIYLNKPFTQGEVFKTTFSAFRSRVLGRVNKFPTFRLINDALVDDTGRPVFMCLDPEPISNNQVFGDQLFEEIRHVHTAGTYLYVHIGTDSPNWGINTTLKLPYWIIERIYQRRNPEVTPDETPITLWGALKAAFFINLDRVPATKLFHS